MKRSFASAFGKKKDNGTGAAAAHPKKKKPHGPPAVKKAKHTERPDAAAAEPESLGKMRLPERDWAAVKWSPEQLSVIDAVRQGRNVFVTGPGGVGKSTLLPYIAHILQEECDRIVRITATTGIAADAIGGMTFHSFVGVGLGQGAQADLIRTAKGSKETVLRWTQVDTLFIDEISMMDPDFFTKVDHIGRALRHEATKPFGGMQLILFGDFFQLPPVITDKEKRQSPFEFAFDTPSWWDLDLVNVELRTIFRQSDVPLIGALNRIRYGEPTAADIALLMTRLNSPARQAPGVKPTVLYSRCRNVEDVNKEHLRQLAGLDYVYEHKTGWITDDANGGEDGGQRRSRPVGQELERYLRRLQAEMLKNTPAEKTVVLRRDAQVMLLINLDQEKGLVNGSRGVVIGFDGASQQHPIVRFQNGQELTIVPHQWKRGEKGYGEVYYTQVPLKLAYAVTIHKSQGMTLDCAVMTIDNTLFEHGQAYVALSRIKCLEGLQLLRFDPTVIRAHPRVIDFYKSGFVRPKQQQALMTEWKSLKSFFSIDALQSPLSTS